MHSSKWISLKSTDIAPSFHPQDAAWSTEAASPYDVPSHVRASYDVSSGCLLIEFRYFESEPVVELHLDNYVVANVGRHTRRVWSVKFNAYQFSRDRSHLADAARNMMQSADVRDVSNRDIAVRAISAKGQSILEAALG